MCFPPIDQQKDDTLDSDFAKSFTVGRFQVQMKELRCESHPQSSLFDKKDIILNENFLTNGTHKSTHHGKFSDLSSIFSQKFKTKKHRNTLPIHYEDEEPSSSMIHFVSSAHPFASILNEIQGDKTIYRGGTIHKFHSK